MFSARPISTMRPRYMTATFWLTSSTIGRSCEMNRYASPRSFCRSRSRFTTCAWIEMSSALVGSSATIRRGRTASTRAIPTRRFSPPRAQLGAAQGGDVAPVEHDAPAARVGQPQHRASDRGLAAAGLPDEADGLVFPEIEAHAVHRRDHAPLTGQHRGEAAALAVVLAQIGDFENGAAHAFPAAG